MQTTGLLELPKNVPFNKFSLQAAKLLPRFGGTNSWLVIENSRMWSKISLICFWSPRVLEAYLHLESLPWPLSWTNSKLRPRAVGNVDLPQPSVWVLRPDAGDFKSKRHLSSLIACSKKNAKGESSQAILRESNGTWPTHLFGFVPPQVALPVSTTKALRGQRWCALLDGAAGSPGTESQAPYAASAARPVKSCPQWACCALHASHAPSWDFTVCERASISFYPVGKQLNFREHIKLTNWTTWPPSLISSNLLKDALRFSPTCFKHKIFGYSPIHSALHSSYMDTEMLDVIYIYIISYSYIIRIKYIHRLKNR